MSVRLSVVAVAAAGMMLGPAASRSASRSAPPPAAVESATAASPGARRFFAPPTSAPSAVLAGTREVRDVTVCSGAAWVATRGGLERYATGSFARRAFGVADGLDTLDVHAVRCEAGRVIATTATGACTADEAGRFHCAPARAVPDARTPRVETLRGEPVTARAEVDGGAFVGTSAAGLFWVPARGAEPRRLTPDASVAAPASFPKKMVAWRGRVWIGTFDDGLYVAPDVAHVADAKKVLGAPFRMVNDVAVGAGALFVASNEGLFVARGADGAFRAVRRVDERGVSGVTATADGRGVYATSSAALFHVRPDKRGGAAADASWWRPAGTRSLQGVAADADGAWLASEDRGAIRFDAATATFVAHDRLAGLPTSWALGIASDGRGGAFVATLRDGALHLRRDGGFERLGDLPSEWTLGVDYDVAGDRLFVSTQDGAVRYDGVASASPSTSPSAALSLLPDARVHAVASLDGADVAMTEAGLAVYPRSPTCQPGLLANAAAHASEQNQ